MYRYCFILVILILSPFEICSQCPDGRSVFQKQNGNCQHFILYIKKIELLNYSDESSSRDYEDLTPELEYVYDILEEIKYYLDALYLQVYVNCTLPDKYKSKSTQLSDYPSQENITDWIGDEVDSSDDVFNSVLFSAYSVDDVDTYDPSDYEIQNLEESTNYLNQSVFYLDQVFMFKF